MRILVLGINYWPEDTGIAVFNAGRCEYLASQGHDVKMCTGFPYYPYWRVPSTYRGRVFATETHNGVTVQRSYVYVPRRITSAARVLHEASFIASATVRAIGSRRPDLLLTVSPPLGLAVTSGLLSLAQGVAGSFQAGLVRQTIVEMAGGYLFITSISEGSTLAVLAERSCDMGMMGYEMTLLAARVGHMLTPGRRPATSGPADRMAR